MEVKRPIVEDAFVAVRGTRSTSPPNVATVEELGRLRPGDQIRFSIEKKKEEQCFVIHRNEEGDFSLVFPNRYQKAKSERAGEAIELGWEVYGPPGPQFFVVVRSSKEVIRVEDLDLDDEVTAAARVVDAVNEINTEEWEKEIYQIQVFEDLEEDY